MSRVSELFSAMNECFKILLVFLLFHYHGADDGAGKRERQGCRNAGGVQPDRHMVGDVCEKCDGCNVELLCNLMKGEIHPEVSVPPEVLAEAGTDPDCKLACEVDPESGTIYVVEADYRYDLTDVSPTLLNTFRKCGICLDDLEMKLKEEAVVYGAKANEGFSD